MKTLIEMINCLLDIIAAILLPLFLFVIAPVFFAWFFWYLWTDGFVR